MTSGQNLLLKELLSCTLNHEECKLARSYKLWINIAV